MNAHFRLNVERADDLVMTATRRGTDRLLGLLNEHHSYDMRTPKGWKKREPKKPPAVPAKPLWFRIINDKPVPTMDNIVRAVANHYGVKTNDIRSESREAKCVHPRMVAVYVARSITEMSFPRIGRFLGGRDHSTAMHAHKKIGRLIAEGDTALKADVDAISALFARPE
jgi:hypothetical protein